MVVDVLEKAYLFSQYTVVAQVIQEFMIKKGATIRA